jgi:hypothetical protein
VLLALGANEQEQERSLICPVETEKTVERDVVEAEYCAAPDTDRRRRHVDVLRDETNLGVEDSRPAIAEDLEHALNASHDGEDDRRLLQIVILKKISSLEFERVLAFAHRPQTIPGRVIRVDARR